MSARILVVDDVPVNVRVLEAKLTAEYFDVITASGGQEALDLIGREAPDIVLLDVMMPDIDGYEVCRRIKADPHTAHIPVVMITALSDTRERVEGLQAGADDFLTKPVNDIALFARVRSLVRLKMMMDELRLRERTGGDFGVFGADSHADDAAGGAVLVVDERPQDAERIGAILSEQCSIANETGPDTALARAAAEPFDLIIVSFAAESFDPLRLCAQIRNQEATRQLPILIVVDEVDLERMAKGLEIGVTDYVMRPIDRNELLARTRTQIRRKRYQDRLRSSYRETMAMAVTDGLTGLYNRNYLTTHIENMMSRDSGKPVSLLMIDIDHFKKVNDEYGHGVGDEVLREFGERIRAGVRGIDLAVRYGGEEFVVLLPDTDIELACKVAERLRRRIGGEPMKVAVEGGPLRVTCSIGVTGCRAGEGSDAAFKRADKALYAAKRGGRNRIVTIDPFAEAANAELADAVAPPLPAAAPSS